MLENKIKELEKAKKAVQSCLDNANCWVDMHGLAYWAERVEKLKNEIKDLL